VSLLQNISVHGEIFSMTVFKDKLYVALYCGSGDDWVFVYDTSNAKLLRTERIGLGDSWRKLPDMTSCKRHHCIYAIDEDRRSILKVEMQNTFKSWILDGELMESLSVTSSGNVLVTKMSSDEVIEYTTHGDYLRHVTLHRDIVSPWHTIELSPNRYVISHGDTNDPLHRVCIIDSSGSVLRSYGGPKGSGSGQLDVPMRLAVNDFIFVLDHNNHRVLLLTPMLSCVREIKSDLEYPTRMCFDEERCQLYLAEVHCFSPIEVYSVKSASNNFL